MTPEQHHAFLMPVLAAWSILARFPDMATGHARIRDLHTESGRAVSWSAP